MLAQPLYSRVNTVFSPELYLKSKKKRKEKPPTDLIGLCVLVPYLVSLVLFPSKCDSWISHLCASVPLPP